MFSLSAPAFSSVIKATDLRITSSNFVSGSIFNENTQAAVTNTASGSLRCSVGITGKGVPINCASNACTNRLTATNTLPDISAFDSHLCADPDLYHPKIQNIGTNPRDNTCPSPYTVDVNIATSGEADTYIRAMSYRYAGEWIKNYTPKCWTGLDNSECPVSGTPVNDHRVLLVTLPAVPTAAQKKSHCCSNAIGGPGNPVFESFTDDPTGASSSRYEQSISTLATCGVELHTELTCGSFCSDCTGTSTYNNWKTLESCMCESGGTPCGDNICKTCSGSLPYQCNNITASSGPGCNSFCTQCSGGNCVPANEGASCGTCSECRGGVCSGVSGGSCGTCGTCSAGTCNDPGYPSCSGACESRSGCSCVTDTTSCGCGGPCLPPPGIPGTPSPGIPGTPSPGTPGTPSPGTPGTPSPGTPGTPSPGTPGTPSLPIACTNGWDDCPMQGNCCNGFCNGENACEDTDLWTCSRDWECANVPDGLDWGSCVSGECVFGQYSTCNFDFQCDPGESCVGGAGVHQLDRTGTCQ